MGTPALILLALLLAALCGWLTRRFLTRSFEERSWRKFRDSRTPDRSPLRPAGVTADGRPIMERDGEVVMFAAPPPRGEESDDE